MPLFQLDGLAPKVALNRPRQGSLLLGVLLSFFTLCAADAAPVFADAAKVAVEGWRKAEVRPMGTNVGSRAQSVQTEVDAAGLPLYHVVFMTDDGKAVKGYVIVAGDDEAEPVLAFSSGTTFRADNPLRFLLQRHMPKLLGALRQAGFRKPLLQTRAAVARAKWETLRGRRQGAAPQSGAPSQSAAPPQSDTYVAPLIQSAWSQDTSDDTLNGPACYNYYTPPYASGNSSNYPCGCVATCFAQVMRLWQYPTTAVGQPVFDITINNTPTTASLLGGDGKGGAYVWANMPLVPSNGVTLAQARQIGVLSHDMAVASMMDFEMNGSSALMSDAATALVKNFHFGEAMDVYTNTSDSQTMSAPLLLSMLTPNLNAGFPVLLGVRDPQNDGHALVCDGYGYNGGTLYHHLNLGWGGDANAWYALPTINTDVDNFNVVDECSFNVFPTGTGEIISGQVTNASGAPVPGVVVTATRMPGKSYSASTNLKGIYAITHVPSSSTFTVSASGTGYTFTSKSVATGASSSGSLGQGGAVGDQSNINFTGAPDPSFFAGAVSLGSGVEYLSFPNGNVFGYYTNASFPWIYHFDMGYMYYFDAHDGKGGADFYDATSGHFFYTSPAYPFPYLYDFTLKAVLYYYPDPNNAGRYTTNPRYFYNTATQQIITQ